MIVGIIFAALVVVLIVLVIIWVIKIRKNKDEDGDFQNSVDDSEMETSDYFTSSNDMEISMDDPLWGSTEDNPVWIEGADEVNDELNQGDFEETHYAAF